MKAITARTYRLILKKSSREAASAGPGISHEAGMSKKSRVIISERAEADLDEIGDYIAAEADEDRAEAVLRKIAEKIQLHATMPLSG